MPPTSRSKATSWPCCASIDKSPQLVARTLVFAVFALQGMPRTFARVAREHERVLRTLSSFASADWQLWQAHTDLEQRVAQRTSALSDMNAVLHKEIRE